ncbi:glycosyltransferase family 2 protein [Desulfovibrio sp. ZJ200]|uniref:glycosyltransferase family 2 protein n=1 Tax=Desulfovibrio sp. ZJ200 TaxID=2709792 RepID=UPI001F14DD5D|nr:glycosyltransferase family 2 protein [Desulfovibrio sp. ZJ200]
MSETARVSVIIPVWNLWKMTAACLQSLAGHTPAGLVEVLAVDNGSDDATLTELEPLGRALWGGAFRRVRLPENLGFAKACNAGARVATADLLFFLNNDTTLTPGWLDPLIRLFDDPALGAAGPLLLYPDGTVQHCGIYLTPFLRVGHLYEHFPGAHPVPRKARPLQAITGAAMMLRRTVFQDCGGFCEEYLNGFEDLDLCCSLRHKGLKVAVAGQSVVYHHASQTPGRFENDTRNGGLLLRRWGQSLRPDLHYLAALDKYRMCIGPSLSCWTALSESREQALNAACAGREFDEAACRALLEQEPLWLGGRLLLMQRLEEQGQRPAALAAGMAALRFFPQVAIQSRVLRLARKEGWHDALPSLIRNVQTELEDNADRYRPRVLEARRRAYAGGDMALAGLLNAWLARYGAGKAQGL